MDRRKPEHLGAGRHGPAFWQEEKENFGTKMMKTMGWEEGKGLGKDENGQKSFLRAVKKDNSLGIGAVKGRDEIFGAANDMYNDLLKRLAAEAKSGPVAAEQADMEVDKDAGYSVTTALKKHEAKTGLYGKFKRAKDASNYDSTSMQEILGRKTATPSPPASSSSSSSHPHHAELDSSLTTTTSKSNIRDYFAKKMGLAGRPAPAAVPATSDNSDSEPSSSPAAAAPRAASRFQVAGGQGFSENFQTNYYEQMQGMAIKGRTGLGLGAANDAPTYGQPREESFADRLKREKKEKESKINVKVKFEEANDDGDDWDAPQRPSLGLGAKAPSFTGGGGMSGFVKSEPPALERVKAEPVVKTEASANGDDDSDSSGDKKKKKKKNKVKEEPVVKEEVESDSDREERLKKEKKAAKKAAKEAAAIAEAEAAKAHAEADAKAAKKAAKRAAKAAAAAEEEAATAAAAADAAEAQAAAAKAAKKAEKRQLAAEAEAAAAAAKVAPSSDDESSSKKKKKRKIEEAAAAVEQVAAVSDESTKEKKKKSKKSKSE